MAVAKPKQRTKQKQGLSSFEEENVYIRKHQLLNRGTINHALWLRAWPWIEMKREHWDQNSKED